MSEDSKARLSIVFTGLDTWTHSMEVVNVSAQQLWAIIPALSHLADELYQRSQEMRAQVAEQAEVKSIADSMQKGSN